MCARRMYFIIAAITEDTIIGSMSIAGTWSEYSVPGDLLSLCVTCRHVWIVDKSERLYYSILAGNQSVVTNSYASIVCYFTQMQLM